MKSLTRPEPKEKVVAQLNLTDCPEGDVLNKTGPDPNVDRFFEGWDNPLTPHRGWGRPSNLRVVLEEGHPVMEYHVGPGALTRCLLTGDDFWRDYTVESEIRIMGNTAKPNSDNAFHVFPWAGIIFRHQDLRHYYLFCLQSPPDEKKIVLYRRADNDWHILAEQPYDIDPSKYYTLKVRIDGNRIHCYVDGGEVFRVTDYLYRGGKTGVRFNTDSRVKSIKVAMTSGEERIFHETRKRHQDELNELRKRYPKPVLWKKMDLSRYWPFTPFFANLRSPESKDLVLFCREPNPQVVALNLEGELLWKKEGSLVYPDVIYRSDGKVEIVGLAENEIVILDGAGGEILKETSLPPVMPPPRRWNVRVANLQGASEARDVILKIDNSDGGEILWAYDEDLKLNWTTIVRPRYGHSRSVAFFDVDNDGRDEILAGATLLNADGEMIWRVEGYEEIVSTVGSRHIDSCVVGDFAQDGEVDPVAFLATGSAGVWVVDALTGKVRDVHYVGHAQGISVGNFRPDVMGLEVLVGTRWDNYGILNLFSGRGERLLTFEPDNVSQGGPPVNWTGDGRQLILLATTPEALGLWDGFGRKVVTFPIEDLPGKTTDYYHRSGNTAACVDLFGDSRDEIIFCAHGRTHIFTQD